MNEPQERAAAEEAWKVSAKKYQELAQNLDEAYANQSAQWIQELVSRVIGA